MAKGLKGITVEIDGNVQPLNKALATTNASAKSLQSELKGVNSLLKLDPNNTELAAQKQVLLKQSVAETENKLKMLTQAEKEASAAGKDINDEGYRNLQREIVLTKTKLESLKAEQSTFDKLSNAAKTFGSSLAATASKIPIVNKLGTAFSEVKDKITKAASENEKIQKIGSAVSTAKEKLNGLKENVPVIGKISDAFGKVGEKVDAVKNKLPSFSSTISAVGSAAASAGQTGFSALTTVVGGTAKAFAAFGTAAATGMVAVGKAAIENYASYEQLKGGVETLFKTSSDTVQKYAANAFKTAGMSANDYMETVTGFSASLLQSVGGNTEEAAKKADMAITDMSDNANKMGTSMESIQTSYQGFAKQNYTMLDNLKLGYGGTKEEMQRLLDDATKISGVKYDISSYADVVDAIHVVQNEMGITGTTAKEASSTIEGSISSTKAAWSNLLTGLADEDANMDTLISDLANSVEAVIKNILPRIMQTAGSITKVIPEILNSMGGMAMEVGGQLGGLIMQLLPQLVSSFFSLIQAAIGMLPTLLPQVLGAAAAMALAFLQGINDTIPQLIAILPQLIQSITSTLTANLPQIMTQGIQIIVNLINGITTAIPSLIQAIVDLFPVIVQAYMDNLPSILEAGLNLLIALVTGIVNAIPQLIAMLPTIITTIVNTLITMLPLIIQAGVTLLSSLISGLVQAIPLLIAMLPTIITSIVNTLIANLPQIIQAGIQLLGALISGLIQAIPMLIAAIPTIVSAIFTTFKNINWGELGLNIIKGIKDGVINAAKDLADAVADAAKSALDAAKKALGIHSPSRVFRDQVGKQMAAGMAIGFTDGVEDEKEGMAKAIPTTFDSYISQQIGVNRAAQTGSTGGFTQNLTINSPEALSPSETARQTRNATRQMILTLKPQGA